MLLSALMYINGALGEGHKIDFSCLGGKAPTPKNYRDSEVLLPSMLDLKGKQECQLRPTPARAFSTYINECESTASKGQCTEWTDGRFFQLTGQHMAFNGGASKWPDLARQNPDVWSVTDKPTAPSVAIYPPGVYRAGPSGHASVIETISQTGELCASSWKAPTAGKLSSKLIRHHPRILYISLAKT